MPHPDQFGRLPKCMLENGRGKVRSGTLRQCLVSGSDTVAIAGPWVAQDNTVSEAIRAVKLVKLVA